MHEKGLGFLPSFSKAKECYELYSKENKSNELLKIGSLYYNSSGIENKYEFAYFYFELSAKLGNNKASYNLGIMYLNGLGVKKN